MHLVRTVLFTFLSTTILTAQNPSADPDGLTLLQQMSQHYSGAKSLYLEATREQSNTQEYSRNWSKTVMVAAISGDKYHYEGRDNMGSALHISDGKTEWMVHPGEHTYTQQPAGSTAEKKIWGPGELGLMQAEGLRTEFGEFAKHYTGATRLPDETLTLGGVEMPCYVVRVTVEQRKGPKREQSARDETLWIEKSTWAVRKTLETRKGTIRMGTAPLPFSDETVTTYTVAQLDPALPESHFQFVPPADAKLVPTFKESFRWFDLTGESAPEIELIGANGKHVPLSSYRGKPVLIDFWATWCAPCVKGLPELAKLNQEAGPKGLVVLTVDEDEEEKTATDFLAKNHYTWPNTHDEGKIADAFRVNGFPVAVLVDSQGKIVFDRSYGDQATLRQAVAGLGPEFASLAPAQKPQPCEAALKTN